MVDPGYNWTGFYAGLNGGYSWGKANTTVFAGTVLATAVGHDDKGGLFGGQIGYNWHINPKRVLGLEADGQWTGEHGRRSDPFASIRTPTPGNDFNIVTTMALNSEFSLPWFATFRGRTGILVEPQPAALWNRRPRCR
jgi:outer membrane immunogenic protein